MKLIPLGIANLFLGGALLALPALTHSALLSQSYAVGEGANNARLTLAAENATSGAEGQLQVAPGTPITVNYAGSLNGGSSFSVFAYGLYQDAQWSLSAAKLLQIASGTYLAGRGFNWGNQTSGTVTLNYAEPGVHRLLFFFGNRSFGHKTGDAVVEAVIEVRKRIVPVRLDLVPHTLNSRSNGKFAVAFAELPVEVSPEAVKLPSLFLTTEAGATPVIRADKIVFADHDGNGIVDLKLTFDRQALLALSSPGLQRFVLEGELQDGTLLRGEVERRVLP